MLNPVKPIKRRRWQLMPKLLLVLGLVLALLDAGTRYYYTSKYKDAKVLVLGHAGSGFLSPLNPFNPLPSNSKASILKALEKHGADGVEVDVQLSKDGVPILYHDVTLASLTERQDTIDNLNAAEVAGLAYQGGFFYDLFHDEKIITLEELLRHVSGYEAVPYLHIDLRNHDPARHTYYARTLLGLLRRYKYPLEKLAFISPNPDFLEAFRQAEPKATLILDVSGNYDQAMQEIEAHGLQGICANGRDMTPERMRQARERGLQVVLFGGKSHSRIARMLEMRPDAIQVNNVAAARRMLD
ncbi:glycerophosphodiester phosphodiesterase [Pontibacter sp. E15-1]|uniref:glycerophosphodiester phosphodiesterase n=1 Tax=Pontibacter sp. E15-1 TaxID=2919918 RepID=UPI001F4F7B9F|nr:glycerophosphodiester phosphodiesterase family protein [Pontibacter sp. E15-1]MCJ8165586.1 glycerophosphodiester phosphodiesterase [Pontibacter sp. E15-1]